MFRSRKSLWRAVWSLALAGVAVPSARLEAHEVRPAYLELRELGAEGRG